MSEASDEPSGRVACHPRVGIKRDDKLRPRQTLERHAQYGIACAAVAADQTIEF